MNFTQILQTNCVQGSFWGKGTNSKYAKREPRMTTGLLNPQEPYQNYIKRHSNSQLWISYVLSKLH